MTHSPLSPPPALHCSIEDQRRLLGAAPYFRSLAAPQVANVQQRFQQRHYPAGQVIQRAGQPATRLAIVGAGTVRLLRQASDGRDILLDILVPGDEFGSLTELGDDVYTETVVAHTECCILSTTSNDFAEILRRYPTVAVDSYRIVAARLRNAHTAIEERSGYTAEQRLARILVRLAARLGREDGVIDLPLSRQDLADMSGITVETASRIMSDFRRDGLISSGRKWIAIANPTALSERAN